MSKRRDVGDKVWCPPYAGFVASDEPQHAEIREDGFEYCVVNCPDPECKEWSTLWSDKGYPLYHVAECQMFDSPEEALSHERE